MVERTCERSEGRVCHYPTRGGGAEGLQIAWRMPAIAVDMEGHAGCKGAPQIKARRS